MTPEKLMELVEVYRCSGGREEHHARKEALMAEFERLCEPMSEVADRFAHSLALELECVLADRKGYYDKAMYVLSQYRTAMDEIHEQQCPTFMGEPVGARKSFAETHPRNPDAKCKCEHWQACKECHPTYGGVEL